MKTNPSLRRRFFWYIAGVGSLFTLCYSLLSALYFERGLETSVYFNLDLEARAISENFQQHKVISLPTGTSLKYYLGIEELPSALAELFDLTQLQHRKLFRFKSDIGKDPAPSSPVHRLTELCSGHTCDLIFLYSYKLQNGQWLLLLRVIGPKETDPVFERIFDERMLHILLLGILSLLGILTLALILTRSAGQPLKSIAEWANSLSLDNRQQAIPNFKFKELDSVAENLHQAFGRISQVVENEHMFLRNASHELRTPLAVMSTNLAVLDKMICDEPPPKKQVVARLQRAATTMQKMTETLLWLSQEANISLDADSISMHELVQECIDESQYLIKQKQIETLVSHEQQEFVLPITACRILISNLIRNAFQYTDNGTVEVYIEQRRILIINQGSQQSQSDKQVEAQGDYGYGLGLLLVEKICRRLNWEYENAEIPGGMINIITFTKFGSG